MTTQIFKSTALEVKQWDEELDVHIEIKEVSEDGTFSGYGSTFGNVDSDRDIIAPGAFSKTLKRKKAKDIKLLWQHDPYQPIGVWEEISEDSKGLVVKGRLILEVEKAKEAYALMKAGAIGSMSIGFAIPKGGYEYDDKKRVRIIKEVDLWEVSIVTFPANPKAKIRRVKEAVPFSDLPIADRGMAWSAEAAERRVRRWAGGEKSLDKMDWERYKQAFLWHNTDKPESLDSYKMLIADVVGDELTAVPRGIFAAAGHLLSAKNVDIPGDDHSMITVQLERYYHAMDLDSPFKVADIGDSVKSYIGALLATCSTEREFERTLREVGFSKSDAKKFASFYEPRRDVEESEIAAKLEEAKSILSSIT